MTCLGGGIGIHATLKMLWALPMRVRFPPQALTPSEVEPCLLVEVLTKSREAIQRLGLFDFPPPRQKIKNLSAQRGSNPRPSP